MRPSLLPLLLSAVLLSACTSDSDPEPGAGPGSPGASGDPASSVGPSGSPPAIEGLEVLAEDPSHEHRDGAIEYDRTPPLGGPHNARWLACDVYTDPVPHEFAVHSLEHGGVWLAYSPDLPEEQVELLEELADSNEEYVLVSPEKGLDSDVVAVTWGAALEATSADDPRLEQFVQAYAGGGQGGEKGAPCRGNGLSLREARGMLESGA